MIDESCPERLRVLVEQAWSGDSSRNWSPDNPARGQCSVTALAIELLCGGEILKTPTPQGPHFYNRVAGRRHDLTASQFDSPLHYEDLPSDAGEAMADTSPAQFAALLRRIRDADAS